MYIFDTSICILVNSLIMVHRAGTHRRSAATYVVGVNLWLIKGVHGRFAS